MIEERVHTMSLISRAPRSDPKGGHGGEVLVEREGVVAEVQRPLHTCESAQEEWDEEDKGQ